MGMTGMEEEPHVIAPKPTLLNDERQQQVETQIRSDGSTPANPPMSEMNQMEV